MHLNAGVLWRMVDRNVKYVCFVVCWLENMQNQQYNPLTVLILSHAYGTLQ